MESAPALIGLVETLSNDSVASLALGALGWLLVLTVAGGVAGLFLGMLVARSAFAWATGRSGAAGCLFTGFLIAGGLVGGAWAGAWIGAGRATCTAVSDRVLIEEMVLRTAVMVATEDTEQPTPDEIQASLESMIATGGDSLQEIVREALAEIEDPSARIEIERLIGPERLDSVLADLRARGLTDAGLLTRVWDTGGFLAASRSSDPELVDFSNRLLETTAPMREHVCTAINGTVIPTAVTGPAVGLGVPLLLAVILAVLLRWAGRDQTPPPTAAS